MFDVVTNAIAHCILIFGFNVGCNDSLEGIDYALSITISLAILAGVIYGIIAFVRSYQKSAPPRYPKDFDH